MGRDNKKRQHGSRSAKPGPWQGGAGQRKSGVAVGLVASQTMSDAAAAAVTGLMLLYCCVLWPVHMPIVTTGMGVLNVMSSARVTRRNRCVGLRGGGRKRSGRGNGGPAKLARGHLPRTAPVGLFNTGNSCFVNATVQMLLSHTSFRSTVKASRSRSPVAVALRKVCASTSGVHDRGILRGLLENSPAEMHRGEQEDAGIYVDTLLGGLGCTPSTCFKQITVLTTVWRTIHSRHHPLTVTTFATPCGVGRGNHRSFIGNATSRCGTINHPSADAEAS